MAKRQQYSHDKETKAAVLAALLAGQGVTEVAEEYKVPRPTVSFWKAQLPPDKLNEIQRKKAEAVGDLLEVYLCETLVTLASQARFFRNEKWLSRQRAADLAVLHGVQTDKAIRLLEAIERANESAQLAQQSAGDQPAYVH